MAQKITEALFELFHRIISVTRKMEGLLIADLRPLVRSYMGTLDFLEIQAETDVLRRFQLYLLDLFQGDELLKGGFLAALRKSRAYLNGSLILHFLLDEPHSRAQNINILLHQEEDSSVEDWCLKHCFRHLENTNEYCITLGRQMVMRFAVTICKEPLNDFISIKTDFDCLRAFYDGSRLVVMPCCRRDLALKQLQTPVAVKKNATSYAPLTLDILIAFVKHRSQATAHKLDRVFQYLSKGFSCSPQLKGWIFSLR